MSRDTPPRPDASSADQSRARRPSFGGDDRGVSELLGAILLFGLLLMLLVLIQVSAVPAWNQQVEYEHNQRVQEDIQQLGSSIAAAAADGVDHTTVVEAGVGYPPRPFLFNPPAAQGTVETTASATLRVQNVDIVGTDYPGNTNTIEASTRMVRYRPDYNQYRNAPTTVYENGLVYNKFDNGYVRQMDRSSIVNGTTIDLVAIDGDLSESSSRATTVRAESTSGPAHSVTVQNTGGPLTIRTPTMLNESQWESILADQLDGGAVGTDDTAGAYVADVRVNNGVLELQMEPGTYTLRMAEVGLGSGATEEGPAYVTAQNPSVSTVPGGTVDLTAQLRDRFNNPVENRQLRFQSSSGTVAPTSATTDSEGEATVRYTAPTTAGVYTVTAQADVDGDGTYGEAGVAGERATFTVVVTSTTGGSGSSDSVSGINPGPTSTLLELQSVTGQGRSYTLNFRNTGTSPINVTGARVTFYYPSSGTFPTSLALSGGGDSITLPVGSNTEFEPIGPVTFGQRGSTTPPASRSFALNLNYAQGNANPDNDFIVLSMQYTVSGTTVRTNYFVFVG